jgi:alkylation response protein AidB-like acyl-CoA dehydrogenase
VLFAALVDGGGSETHRYFALPRNQVEIIDTWHAVGLKGSASNDVTVADVFVPEHRTLSIAHLKGGASPGNAINTSPLYRTPSYCVFGVYISAALLGIAEAGLELYLDGARSRVALVSRQKVGGYPTQQVKVAEASAAIAAARQLLLSICDEAGGIAAARRPAKRRAAGEVPLARRVRRTPGEPRCRAAVGCRRQQQRLQRQSDVAHLPRHQRRRPPFHAELGRQRLDPRPRPDGLRAGRPDL